MSGNQIYEFVGSAAAKTMWLIRLKTSKRIVIGRRLVEIDEQKIDKVEYRDKLGKCQE